jgi:hypothetical protein
MITCPKCGCDTAGRGHKEETCLRRQLAQRTQEREEARAAFDSSAEFGAIETKRADSAEAKLERIRVAASDWLLDTTDTHVLFACFNAEFGKDGW